MEAKQERNGTEPTHPIGVVAARTGLSPDVLRVWERRYGVVVPERGAGGQRLYSDADIERLRLLARATAAGRGISQVAELPLEALTELVRGDETATRPGRSAMPPNAEMLLAEALARVRELDGPGLELLLRRAAYAWGTPVFLEHIAAPLLREIGDQWHAGGLRVSHEHLASATVRGVIHGMGVGLQPGADAPGLLVATPAGERHEIGALLVAAAAAAAGWRVTYLGADLPADEIARSAVETRSRAVALSIVAGDDAAQLAGELAALRAGLPAGVDLLVGGAAADRHASAIDAAEASRIGSLSELTERLAGLL